ncbi:hypothetical protein GCM10012286_80810 [Streptomyces lasiicapitis]|uniref:N-acetyltransferase domain-containing protein n=2 Tax=Streptomyces TaxID=1883 RepID=A0ABQ2MX31_9ACTN|nr:hypothetical protein GCM10012286_80810 [Streptomyces lasiicapitis]
MAWPRREPSRAPVGDESSDMAGVRLRRVNRWLAEDMRQDLADLYMASCETGPEEEHRSRSREEFLSRLTGDIRRPGFAMVIAETDGLVGCAFGFPVHGDGSWWHGFDGALPRSIEQLTESDGVFAVTNVLVRPHPQDQDLARRLQERLLADHQASLGTTLVDPADHPALNAFRSWGWQDIGEIWRPGLPTMFRVLVLPLGERTVERLEGLGHHAWTRWPG